MSSEGARRVLVVDDDPDYALLVRRALGRSGRHQVVGEARTPPEGLAAARTLQPDVVLLDAVIPGWDPLQELERWAEAAPAAAVVVTAGRHLTPPDRSAGAVAVLPKSTPASELAPAIDAAVSAAATAAQHQRDALRLELPASTESPRVARRAVVSALAGWGLGHLCDTVELLVSEAVSNAVLHARSSLLVTASRRTDRVRVEVVDRVPGVVRRRRSSADATSGRGFELLDLMAAGWGIDHLADGKRVWFELDATPGPD